MHKKFIIFALFIVASTSVGGYAWLNYLPIEKLSILDKIPQKHISNGLGQMSKHKVLICGITRDNDAELPSVIKHIEYTGSQFKDYRVVLFENDSKDNTKKILKDWQISNSKVHVITKDFANIKRPSLGFLATARNFYIDKVMNDPQYKDFDIMMVVDMDMVYGWDIRGVADSFAKIDKWDAVCSNGIYTADGVMYDLSVYRAPDFPYNISSRNDCKAKLGAVTCNRVYPVGSKLVPVDSCFGGMAFYKKSFISGCTYASIDKDCEHVPFHTCLKEKNNGHMYMNPSQVIRYTHYSPYSWSDIPTVIRIVNKYYKE